MSHAHRPSRSLLLAGLLATIALLGACGGDRGADPDTGSASATALGGIVKRATDSAREKLATENISLSHSDKRLPKAEITPEGDLLVAGKAVTIDDRQRTLLLEHRAGLVAVAEAGIEVGLHGADLGLKAAKLALAGALSGNSEDAERQIEAEARKIEVEAHKLCDLLPALLASQQALAASIPEFVPYANMDQGDIDDCRSSAGDTDNATDIEDAIQA